MTKLYDDGIQANTLHYDDVNGYLSMRDDDGMLVSIAVSPVGLISITRKMLKIAERNIPNFI